MQQEMKNEIFSLYVRCSFISPLKEEVDTSPKNKIFLLKVSFREKKNDAISRPLPETNTYNFKRAKKKSASYNEMTFTKNRGECDVFTTKYFSYY